MDTICEGCGNRLPAKEAIWTDDGSAFHPRCHPSADLRPAAQPGVVKAIRDVLAVFEGTIENGSETEYGDRCLLGQAKAELSALAAPVSQEPVAEVLWYDPRLHEGENQPRKIIDASIDFMERSPIGTKLYATPQPLTEGEPSEAEVERIAKHITEWLGHSWEWLGDGSVVAKGFPVFPHGQFGWGFQGRKDDMRDLARVLLAAKSKGGA